MRFYDQDGEGGVLDNHLILGCYLHTVMDSEDLKWSVDKGWYYFETE